MSHFTPVEKLTVLRHLASGESVLVGALAQNAKTVFFQYDANYLQQYHSLSPFQLPFDQQLHAAPSTPHGGLHGAFADSLPDGWGLLLMNRVFRQHGIPPQQLTAMDRLAYTGNRAIGALEYSPASEHAPNAKANQINVAKIGEAAQALFEERADELLAQLATAGSSGGARPKAQIYLHPQQPDRASINAQPGFEPWLVKFTSGTLPLAHEEGLCEAAYLTMAAKAGIEVPQWQLLSTPQSSQATAWLALRRFDCSPQGGRYHLHSLCGLLDADFRTPSMDYQDVIKASQVLCNNPQVGQSQFARAVFNLFALNQDDHSKNWAFLQEDNGQWRPSPFYDVTFSPNPYNEHATAFQGYGKNPPLKAMQQLARQANFSHWKKAQTSIEKVLEGVNQWHEVARTLGVSQSTRKLIATQLNTVWQANKGLLGR